MDLATIQTQSGKTFQDFTIPAAILANEKPLISLILRSESIDDSERQYWFTMMGSMTPSQIEKLRGIFLRERQRLDDIDRKYGKDVPVDEDAQAMAVQHSQNLAQLRKEKQAELRAREQEAEEDEKFDEEALLGQLNEL